MSNQLESNLCQTNSKVLINTRACDRQENYQINCYEMSSRQETVNRFSARVTPRAERLLVYTHAQRHAETQITQTHKHTDTDTDTDRETETETGSPRLISDKST